MKLTTKQLERWVEDCKHLPQNEPAAMAKELLLLRARDGAAKEVIKAAKAWLKFWKAHLHMADGAVNDQAVRLGKAVEMLNKKKGRK